MVIMQFLLHVAVPIVTMLWNDHLPIVQASLAKPNCSEKCGNISVPFPFGMGPGCFWSQRYAMVCKETPHGSTTHKLIWALTRIEVINISLEDQTLTIAYPVDLRDPFCERRSYINSMGCLSNIGISSAFDHLSYKGSFKTSIPITLNWAVITITIGPNTWPVNPNFTTSFTRECNPPSSYGYKTVYACRCNSGYQGNPYLEDGCEDINECEEEGIKHNCLHCQNLPGSYNCSSTPTHWNGNHIIVGFGSSIGALVLFLFSWRLHKVIQKIRAMKMKQKYFERNGGLLLQQYLSSSKGNVEKSKLFESKELEKATDCFNDDRILGRGGQGTVYKGMLTDGRIVAIKKSKSIDEGNIENFINEVFILASINHRNVVKLLGCCLETKVPLLVYEYIPNGTLYDYIHNPKEEFELTWEVRLRIATEVGGALSYLHSAASIPIYHRDIKSTNILLDDKYRAKVADFGTSRSVALDQTHLTIQVQGTFGYLDPEYFQSSKFTDKSDVYSFGVILVELLTGKRPISSSESNEEIKWRGLAAYFSECVKENQLFDMVDHHVLSQGRREEIVAFADLARRCLCHNGKKRPTMKEVTLKLESITNPSQEHSSGHEIHDYRGHDWFDTEDTENGNTSSIKSFRTETIIHMDPLLEHTIPLLNTC